jgi:hypothetical protein
MICPRCGSDKAIERYDSVVGFFCPDCLTYAITTGPNPPIFDDETIYHVYMAGSPNPSTDQMRAFAHVTGTNFLIARARLIQNAEIEVFSGPATKVVGIQTRLSELNANFRIDPAFNWTEDDMHGLLLA